MLSLIEVLLFFKYSFTKIRGAYETEYKYLYDIWPVCILKAVYAAHK